MKVSIFDILLLVIIMSYIIYLIYENYYYKRLRKKLKYVIHVNGIRGKSTVTRLIDAGLRKSGYKVFSKTTGTTPIYIDVNNCEHVIKRLGPANIKEQYKILDKAIKDGAEVLVIECMAVNPELQYYAEHHILRSDISVITNVRYDHLDVMGDSLESIAYSLSNTIPDNGCVILGDDTCSNIFNEVASKVNSKVIVSGDYEVSELDTFKENICTSLDVAKYLNLDEKLFLEGLKDYKRDPGCFNIISKNNNTFINGFSINDPESILKVYNERIKDKFDLSNLSILVNTRLDRIFRTNQMIDLLEKLECKNILLTGSNLSYVRKNLLNKESLKNKNIIFIKDINELKEYELIFGIGNIQGFGQKVIDYFGKGVNND